MTDEDKRFDATPSRRRRAQREGNVARSADVSSIAAYGGSVLAAGAAIPLGAAAVAAAVREAATDVGRSDGGTARSGIPVALLALAVAALLPAGAAALAGASAALSQGGGLRILALHAELKRLDPSAGLKRMFGSETVVAVVRASAAFAVALAAVVPPLRDAVAAGAILGAPGAAGALVASTALRACAAALAVGAAFAVADYALARRRWLRGLKMSFEELRRDAKENDGDPQARSRRKSAHRAVVRGSIGRTREASFVVVNPTHVAVALRYAPPAVPVPEILVRALDDVAVRVRALAREHRIPIVEDVVLARLLYAQGESGRAIPPAAYVAVAQIVAALAREGLL